MSKNNRDVMSVIAANVLDIKLLTARRLPLSLIVTNLCSLLTCKIVNISCMPMIMQIKTSNEIVATVLLQVKVLKIIPNPSMYRAKSGTTSF